MENIILIVSIGIMNILCFFIGAKVGQKVVNKDELKLPNLNPMQVVRSYEERKEEEQKERDYKDNLEAINNYNGM